MMSPFSFCIAIMVVLHFHFSFVNGCSEDERSYLLDFRSWLNDSSGRLNSWQQFNCCQWAGVICDHPSGHVVSLDLKYPDYDSSPQCWRGEYTCALRGKIHPSLFNLQHLQYLDLSENDFNSTAIPPQLAKLQRLTFLSLADADFGGEIPLELGNITTLRHLDLGWNGLESRRFGGWITSLRRLEYLDMTSVNLSMANDHWRTDLSSLPNLREIHLSGCGLSGRIPSLLNLTHLSHLDLSWNSFNSSIPAWFQNVSSLVSLGLSGCDLKGSIPSNFLHRSSTSLRRLLLSNNDHLGGVIPLSLANFSMLDMLDVSYNNMSGDLPPFGSLTDRPSSLTYLDLSNNQISGTIAGNISKLSYLFYLDLSNNQLCGTIPDTISKLVRLDTLVLSSNKLTGSISPHVLNDLTHLTKLDFSKNYLTFNISSSWIPQFTLGFLGLGSCNLQGEIPGFLSTQFSLEYLDLSDNNIVGNIPTWFWDLPIVDGLNLSHNRLEGSLPPVIPALRVDFHNNSFHGSIPHIGGWSADMSENRFNGSIPRSLCSLNWRLKFLDLSKNKLSGVIPDNLSKCSQLVILNLAQNYLEGEIPEQLGNLSNLQTLNLNENKLQGAIPPSIANCWKLRVFDIGKNKIQGSIPVWIAELTELKILNLGFNQFQGTFISELLNLRNLQILDLSHNNLSGLIPESLQKLSAMVNQSQSGQIEIILTNTYYGFVTVPMIQIMFVNQVTLWIKGRATSYPKIMSAFKFMDLSHNKLSGNIPREMGELKGLIALNISNNNLRGTIPESLGGMAQLESLDLSGNMLSGNIPAELLSLTFLSVLNLSNNNLSGLIPQGKQFATFEGSSYLGNPNLRGPPLESGTPPRSDWGERGNQNSTEVIDGDTDEMDRWWAVSVGLCFGVGFASVIAVLCFHLKWRYKCFALQDSFIQYLFQH